MSGQPGLFEAPRFPAPDEAELAKWRERGPKLEANILAILKSLFVQTRPCRACGTQLFFVMTREGAPVPYTADGTNHFKNCPHPERFSRKAAR